MDWVITEVLLLIVFAFIYDDLKYVKECKAIGVDIWKFRKYTILLNTSSLFWRLHLYSIANKILGKVQEYFKELKL